MNQFEETVDRAKKAYFDARELLRQYHDLKDGNLNFGSGLDGLCDQISKDLPLDFPIGDDCLDLPPEEVINRFIAYYELWALERLSNTVAAPVADAIDAAFAPPSQPIRVAGIDNTEEIVLLTSTFPVGPIPVTLQVMMTADYGVDANARLLFSPGNLVRVVGNPNPTPATAEAPLAYIGVSGSPYAAAGVALFVGAGFDVGIVAAKIGIQGAVSLGHVSLPLEAGAGVTVGTILDEGRAAAEDEDERYMLVDQRPLIPMKRYEINAMYKYGGTLVMSSILDGQIDVVAKIRLLFFSRKYRAQLVHFNGFCTDPECRVDLFGGGGEVEVPFQFVDWATVLMPTRFLRLKGFGRSDYRAAGGAALDVGRSGELFYDNLCTCIPRFEDADPDEELEQCQRNADCCGYDEMNDFCFVDPDDGMAKCSDCRGRFESCNHDGECCEDDSCFSDPADGSQFCIDCRTSGDSCNDFEDCCQGGGAPRCLDLPDDGNSVPICVPLQPCDGFCESDDDCMPIWEGLALECNEAAQTCARVDGDVCSPVD